MSLQSSLQVSALQSSLTQEPQQPQTPAEKGGFSSGVPWTISLLSQGNSKLLWLFWSENKCRAFLGRGNLFSSKQVVELEEALGLQKFSSCTAEGNLSIFTTLTLGLIKDANTLTPSLS